MSGEKVSMEGFIIWDGTAWGTARGADAGTYTGARSVWDSLAAGVVCLWYVGCPAPVVTVQYSHMNIYIFKG